MGTIHAFGGYTLITGGAGFIGCNVAKRLLAAGERVVILDNLSRAGVEKNAEWLKSAHGELVTIELGDCRDFDLVSRLVRGADRVFHFAAQVAVTSSLTDPLHDFEVNARGSLNVLEAARRTERRMPIVFTSTNKVYGGMPDIQLALDGRRYEPTDDGLRSRGVGEDRPLDFHSPYGCSKGSADQYVIDYARSFGLPAVVFRMSCIYGPRQFGTEDQGWVAHFMLSALRGEAITIYGDGCQVRDVLYVEDLVDALLLASSRMNACAGQAFNIGGGPENAVSLLELIDRIEVECQKRPQLVFEDWRVGDQRYYVSNCRKFGSATGWRPRVPVALGVPKLREWLASTLPGSRTAAEPRRMVGVDSV